MNIIDQFTDVDFTRDPRYVRGDLGVPFARLFGGESYERAVGVLTDAEIARAMEQMEAEGGGADKLVTRIYDQRQEGSCVANATSQSHEIVQALQFGLENVVHLSAISLYKRIGRSPQSGAMVSDGIDEMRKRGILPLDTPENRARFGGSVMPNTGFSTPYPPGWEETAKQFAGFEGHVVESVQGILSALCNQHPVVVGREGHSICYCRVIDRSGKRVVKYANSWGNWGDEGFGYDTENQIRKSANWAFALRSVVVPTR